MCLRRLMQQLKAGNAQPLKGIGRAARFEGAPAQKASADGLDACRDGENLLAGFNGAWAGDDRNLVTPDGRAVGKLDDSAFGAKCAAGELIRRADAVDPEYAGQHFKLAQVQAGCGAYSGKNRLGRAGGSMDVDPCFLHHVDDGIYLFFGGLLLHGYDHCFVPVSGASAPVPWPDGSLPRLVSDAGDADEAARAFLSDANSFLCKARITSIMRS